MDKVTEDEISDTVLYRNLYTNILSQQINAENRLFRLIMAREGQDKTFDKHLAEVRARVEKDRIRIQKLGERLVLMEKKEMQVVLKGESTCPTEIEYTGGEGVFLGIIGLIVDISRTNVAIVGSG